ncbi:PQQ-dependent sugar dehydrogenase [Ichthyenterobacterium magnum]|uniref:Putative secreted protein (Por secretion system target) n=1 Tax=Ichthyenterobacterium magnum TaxID=1230530 RepID=A0A420DKS7_9FLAO|nr:PQQ-dependent sugar dehydrogenase [Ichthyenterobacterium magnum]RKE94791.1 putative secreted protein (Por secretion system target) [Ichthyenterobacterium magnum]
MKKLLPCLILIFFFRTINAQLPVNYSVDILPDTFVQPMGTIFNDDGTKMFVWTYTGQVFLFNWNGSDYIKQETPVLDISHEVGAWRDFGLLSICLDPNFESNGLIYMFYAVDRHHLLHFGTPNYDSGTNNYFQASISRVTRYQLNHLQTPMTTDYSSRLVLLGESITTGIPLTHQSHAGGTILFGNDGTLLITTGDNASYATTDVGSANETYFQQALDDGILRDEENVGAFRSQMINSLCGKVLRLDPTTGNGISSNPFYDSNNPRSAKSRVYAMGFRNPFRAAIKPNSGSVNPADANPGILFVVDVGWFTWEDLHIIDKPGLNAGWPLYEGQSPMSNYFTSGAINLDEGNQTFESLCAQPSSFVDDVNPANRRYTHRRPAITWKHGSDRVRVPWFNGVNPVNKRVGASGSPTTGIEFRGNAGVAGTYIYGDGFGAALNGKFLFSDYTKNWVNIATLNSSNVPWVSHVSEFAPDNYGLGIVHMMQNPLDGSVFFTNIFDGTIRRFSFYDDTLNAQTIDVDEVNIYPNPTNKFINVTGVIDNLIIKVFNVSGQLMLSQIITTSQKIDLSLDSGLYFVKLESKSRMYTTKKLIIK